MVPECRQCRLFQQCVIIRESLPAVFSCYYMRKLFFVWCVLFILPASAQELVVLQKNSKKPVAHAHIVCRNIVTQTDHVFETDTTGIVILPAALDAEKPLLITIVAAGYASFTDTIRDQQNRIFYLSEVRRAFDEVVVTAQYAPGSPEKAVHKIKVIDAEKIAAMNAQNLRDVLTNELNIRLSQDNVLGSGLSLQGISGQNVKILVDGVPVNGRLNGNIDVSQINMNNVERIEIVEGPLSVSYGTDALAGTINIITKKKQAETFSASSANYYESSGQYNFTGRIGLSKAKNTIVISGGRNYFDGWRTDDDVFHFEKERVADSLRYKNWKPKEQFFGTLFYSRFIKNIKLGYTGDYFCEQVANRGLPRAPYAETAFDDYYTTGRLNNSVSATGQLNKNVYLNTLIAYNQYHRIKNTYYKDLTTLEQVLTETPGDQDTTRYANITARGSIASTRDSAKLNYEIGYDINHETAFGLRIENGKQTIGDYALFTSAEYSPLKKITIRPGLRAMYNSGYKAPLVPSLHFRYAFNKTHTLRFSYARGFRAPSVKELYFFFVDINHNITGNPELLAEQSDNLNLSVSYGAQKGKCYWKTEHTFFYTQIANQITLAQADGMQYTYFNLEQFRSFGVQLQTEMRWTYFTFAAGAAFIGRYNQLSEEYDAETYVYTPEGKCNLQYAWDKQQMQFSLFYKYTGKLPSFGLDANNGIYKTTLGDYHTADVTVSRNFLEKRLSLAIGSKNLFDVKNVPGVISGGAHTSGAGSVAVGMGRTYFVSLHIKLDSKK